jgi:hypothetical protein
MSKIIKFLESLLSRRIMFYAINKVLALYLLHYYLQNYFIINQVYVLSLFGISSIYDLVILNEINFEKVKTELALRSGNGRNFPQ